MKFMDRMILMVVPAVLAGSLSVYGDTGGLVPSGSYAVGALAGTSMGEGMLEPYVVGTLVIAGVIVLLMGWVLTLKHVVKVRTQELLAANKVLQEQQEELTASNEEIEASLEQLVAIEQEISRQKVFYEALFLNTPDAVVRLDSNHAVLDVNQRFIEMFGYSLEEIRGRNLDDFVAGKDKGEEAKALTAIFLAGGDVSAESIRYGKGDRPIEVSIKGIPILYQNWSDGGYTIYSDIGHRKTQERKLMYHSNHDDLTGLYNRRRFGEQALRVDQEWTGPVSVIVADVNGLKLTNDALGTEMGDSLIKIFADIFSEECGAERLPARIGGDDFAVILPGFEALETEKIVKEIKHRCAGVRLSEIPFSVSFGWAERKTPAERISDTLKTAEAFMNRHKLTEATSARGDTIQAIINTLHEKNKREEEHSQRVSILSRALGEALGVDDRQLRELKAMGLLHDIGKIAIDETILNKTGQLSAEEFDQIKSHPEIGYRILSSVHDMAEMAEYVLSHHERWDGTGYPRGLKGTEIPYLSRIIGVVDAYDAMTRDRAYRKAMTEEAAIKELEDNAGIQFDPEIVSVFLSRPDVRFSDLPQAVGV